jgi:hypothetical protein
VNPCHLANWTVTHVDWLDWKWHPKSYAAQDVTQTTLAAIQAIWTPFDLQCYLQVPHSFRMFWIYVFNIVPQDWDLQVYHMIVGAHISVVAASLVNARTNWFHSLLLQARSLFQSSKCSTVVQSLTLQTVDFLAGNYLSSMCQQWWRSKLVKLCLLFALMGLDQYLVYYTATNYLKAGRYTSSGKTKLHWSLGANHWTLTCDWIQLCTWMGSKLVRKLLQVN